jgi:hypothetical protein
VEKQEKLNTAKFKGGGVRQHQKKMKMLVELCAVQEHC